MYSSDLFNAKNNNVDTLAKHIGMEASCGVANMSRPEDSSQQQSTAVTHQSNKSTPSPVVQPFFGYAPALSCHQRPGNHSWNCPNFTRFPRHATAYNYRQPSGHRTFLNSMNMQGSFLPYNMWSLMTPQWRPNLSQLVQNSIFTPRACDFNSQPPLNSSQGFQTRFSNRPPFHSYHGFQSWPFYANHETNHRAGIDFNLLNSFPCSGADLIFITFPKNVSCLLNSFTILHTNSLVKFYNCSTYQIHELWVQ